MLADERRKIHELVARYELEPELRDVYVEGVADQVLIRSVLEDAGHRGVKVYTIDTVDVPTATVLDHGLTDGSKSRVIALCRELEAPRPLGNQVTGVVDTDFDALLGLNHDAPHLLKTDYTCMEMYSFNEQSLGRFCERHLHKPTDLANVLLQSLRMPLEELFFIRATNETLALRLAWLAVEDQVSFKKDAVPFDADDFVTKYLSKGKMLACRPDFVAKRDELRAKAHTDPRHQIHGHDFIKLLAKRLKSEVKSSSLCDPEVVARTLPIHSMPEYRSEPLFQSLLLRVTT